MPSYSSRCFPQHAKYYGRSYPLTIRNQPTLITELASYGIISTWAIILCNTKNSGAVQHQPHTENGKSVISSPHQMHWFICTGLDGAESGKVRKNDIPTETEKIIWIFHLYIPVFHYHRSTVDQPRATPHCSPLIR